MSVVDTDRESASDALQRFFDGLAPYLEAHRELDRRLNERLAHRFNPLDYLRTNETALSALIAGLLDPEASHGQGALFLDLPLEGLGIADWTGGRPARVYTEWPDRIDVSVELTDRSGRVRCLAFENKPYAGDQRQQIERYAASLTERYRDFRLVYLTPRGAPPPEWSIDEEGRKAMEKSHTLLRMPYVEEASQDGSEGSAAHREHGASADALAGISLWQWLQECRQKCEAERLRSFLRDVQDFIEQRFGGKRMPTENDIVTNFLRRHPEQIETALLLKQSDFDEDIRGDLMRKIGATVVTDLREDDLTVWADGAPGWRTNVRIGRCGWKDYSYRRTPRAEDDRKVAVRWEWWGRDQWGAGVSFGKPRDMMNDDERRRFDQLEKSLDESLRGRFPEAKSTLWWPWAITIRVPDAKLKDYLECCDDQRQPAPTESHPGKKLMETAVSTMRAIAEIAIPIIEEVEGPTGRSA